MKKLKTQSLEKLIKTVVIFFLILLAVQSILSMQKKSVTIDEIMYIASGYYHLKTGDFQMNMTNPPLMKIFSALPLLSLKLELPVVEKDLKEMNLIEQWKYSRSFLYDNCVDADIILFLARLPIVMVSMLLGFFVFKWGRELFGYKAGLFALLLYAFSPNILAHSRLATQDIGLTVFMFISTYYWWKYMRDPELKFLLFCSLFFGFSILTKTTAFFLVPIYFLYALIIIVKKNEYVKYEKHIVSKHIKPENRFLRSFLFLIFSFLIIGLFGILILNIGYRFQGIFTPMSTSLDHSNFYQKLPVDNILIRKVADIILEVPLPVPSPFIEVLRSQFGITSVSGGVYFAGKIYTSGLWYLMIVTFLIKTPISLLALLALSFFSLLKKRQSLNAEWLIIFFIIILVAVFSYLANINVGLRYILPIYPMIFVLVSRLLCIRFKRQVLFVVLISILSIWYVISSLSIHPHYLAYFNEFIGGPKNGYKYLADSNIDWGQDLKGLKRYMEEKNIQKIKLAYFGSADASYYGINYEYLPSVGLAPKKPGQYWWYEREAKDKKRLEPQTGIIAMSVNILISPGWLRPLFYDSYSWIRKYEPVDNVGYSILIYDIE